MISNQNMWDFVISYIESNKIFGITECKLQLKLNLNEASLVKSKQQKTDLKKHKLEHWNNIDNGE